MDILDVMSDSDCSDTSDSNGGNTSSSESSVSNHSDSSIVAFETARVLKQSVDLPKGLCEDASIYDEFFSLDTWNQLAAPIQMHLQQFLPKFSDDPRENDAERRQTVLALFDNTIERFGSTPLTDFQRNLEEGNFRPEIARVQAAIEKSKRREHRFQECERISRMAKSMVLSRDKLLQLAYNSAPGASLRVNASCASNGLTSTSSNLKSSAVTQRSKKRYFNEISSIAAATGLNDADGLLTDDEDYPGEPPCRMTRMQRRHFNSMQGGAMSPGSESRVQSTTAPRGGCLDHLVDAGGFFQFSDDMYRQRIHQHKKRKLEEPDNPELATNGVELVDILTATQLSATVRRALAQSTKHSAKKTKIKSEPTIAAPPESHLPLPLHIKVHNNNSNDNNTQLVSAADRSAQSPTIAPLLTINKVEEFPEVSSPPPTPSPAIPTALPTTVFQHLSPNPPSFHKQLPPPTTSIQQELFADQSVSFQTDSESEDEPPIKSEPVSPIAKVASSPDLPIIHSTISDTPIAPISFPAPPSGNGFVETIPVPLAVNQPLITVQVVKQTLTSPPPQPIKEEPELNIVPTVLQIKSEVPTISSNYISPPPITIHMPQYGGTVKAATLSDLEGFDMMHLPVDLDDSGNIDLLNEIDVESIEEVTDTKQAAELLQESHSSFFVLIREIFCSNITHRTTIENLEAKISGWLANPITALNDWYVEAENWLTMIASAVQFLVGEFHEQPEDYVPYVEYKPQLLIYQWIGAGRDSDQHLNLLCDFWLQRISEVNGTNRTSRPTSYVTPRISKSSSTCGSIEGDDLVATNAQSTERLSSPLPPRCPTQWTVAKANDLEVEEFREQERRRFENPHLSFTYRLHGFESVVGPVKGIYTQIPVLSKARGHNMLTIDRPTFVTILTLVRDATARLPNGEGTRSEICELLRSSQYINQDAADSVLQTIVSGALDRMHTEHDPCVRYDPKRKIWIYLHRNRSEEEFEKMHQQFQGVSKHKKQSGRKMKNKSLIKSPIVATNFRPSIDVSPVSSKSLVLTNVSSASSIAMLPPLPIVASPLVSTAVINSPTITASIVSVQSPQPMNKSITPQPLEQLTLNPLPVASVQPLVPVPAQQPITMLPTIVSPLQVQPKQQQQLPLTQLVINKPTVAKKIIMKPDMGSIKPITQLLKIDKTDKTGLHEATTLDGPTLPLAIGKAKLAPAANHQPVMAQHVIAQRITTSSLESKTIPIKKTTRVIIPSTSLLTTHPQSQVQPHLIPHAVQPHVIPQSQRIQQISSPTIKIAHQPPPQTQLPQIQQIMSPTIKLAQHPLQSPQTSFNATLIKPTFNAVTASTLSITNVPPKASVVKTTVVQQPSTSNAMHNNSQQPQQSILIQNHNRTPTQMFVSATTKKTIKPAQLVQQHPQQQTSNQNFMIPVNVSMQSIMQTNKVMTTLATHQTTPLIKPVIRATTVPVISAPNTPKTGISLLQQNQPTKSVVRASTITPGKSLISPSVAAANMIFQHQQSLQKTQILVPANIVPNQAKVTQHHQQSSVQPVIIPKIMSTTAKGQSATLTPVQQRLLLQNIIAQQKQQRSNAGNSINLVPNTVFVSTPNSQQQQTHLKNVIVSQQQNSNFMQRIISTPTLSTSAATTMILTSAASQPSTISSMASSGLTTKPTSTTLTTATGNSLINRQIIQIQQNNSQLTQSKPPASNTALGKMHTVSTSNLTPQQQQNLLQSIKQQQMRVQNQQANATPQQQTLMVKQQQVLQQIQKQLQHQQKNTITTTGTSLLNQPPTGAVNSSISQSSVSASPSTITSSITPQTSNAAPQTVTRIIRPGIVRQQPFIQTVSSQSPITSTSSTMPATMTKVLSNTTGQIISLESLLQKQGQSIGSGTTLRVAGTKPGQGNIIQLAGGPGSAMSQYAIVSQGPQGRSMISLTSTPQRLVNSQGAAATTSSASSSSFGSTTYLKTMADSPVRSTISAPSITQQPKITQQSLQTKAIGIQSVTSSAATRIRPNASAIRMMNTSNLNIAQIAGKPVIISSKQNGPTQLLQQTTNQPINSRQNVIWQNPTTHSNTPIKLNQTSSTNYVINDQSVKMQTNDQSPTGTSRVSVVNPQTVMFGNQMVKLQPTANKSQQQQHQSLPTQQLKAATQPKTTNTSILSQSGTTRTVVLGQTGQTIRVHSPAQTGVSTNNNNMQGLATMSMGQTSQHAVSVGHGIKNTIKGSQLTTVAGQQRVVLAVQGGGQILLPSGFQGGSINIKSLQGLKVIPMMQQNVTKDASGNNQRQGFTQIVASPKVPQPPNSGAADS